MSLGAILAGAGGIIGGLNAMGQSNGAMAAEQALIQQKSKLFNLILGKVKTADQQGQWDPNKQIDQMGADLARAQGTETGNAAGAARVLGYQPGDSEPQRSQENINSKYQFQFADMANNIRNSAFQQKLNAYNSVNSGVLDAGINAYGNIAAQTAPNMGGFFAGISPFLNGQKANNPYSGQMGQSIGGAVGGAAGGNTGVFAGLSSGFKPWV